MLNLLRQGQGGFERPALSDLDIDTVVWIDLFEPTRAEEDAVEKALGIDLPTREDMAEIELSSRLYRENNAAFMTASLLVNSERSTPTVVPVTFVLVDHRLVTIRYHQPKSFVLFGKTLAGRAADERDGPLLMLDLLDLIVDRLADAVERLSARVEKVSSAIFNASPNQQFRPLLTDLGRAQTANGKILYSLTSLARIMSFLQLSDCMQHEPTRMERLRTLHDDVQSLSDHSGHLGDTVTFLLDGALGLINIEQNSIIKIFSVAAVAFLPPTLIASIYGMNFQHMPELAWRMGYPLALAAMVISAVVPLWVFKRKGWL